MFTKHSVFVVDDNDDDLTHNSRLAVHTLQKKKKTLIVQKHTHTHIHTHVHVHYQLIT